MQPQDVSIKLRKVQGAVLVLLTLANLTCLPAGPATRSTLTSSPSSFSKSPASIAASTRSTSLCALRRRSLRAADIFLTGSGGSANALGRAGPSAEDVDAAGSAAGGAARRSRWATSLAWVARSEHARQVYSEMSSILVYSSRSSASEQCVCKTQQRG